MRIAGISYEYREDGPTREHMHTIPALDEAYIEMEGGDDGPIRFKLEMRRGKLVVTAASSIALSLRPLSEHEIVIGESGSKQFHPHLVQCPECKHTVEARHGKIKWHDRHTGHGVQRECEGTGQPVKDFNPFAALDAVSHKEPEDG
jgi:hypothetical protein